MGALEIILYPAALCVCVAATGYPPGAALGRMKRFMSNSAAVTPIAWSGVSQGRSNAGQKAAAWAALRRISAGVRSPNQAIVRKLGENDRKFPNPARLKNRDILR
jgi:hypothetical protein